MALLWWINFILQILVQLRMLNTEQAEPVEAMRVPALGRPFMLGALYDIRRDHLVTGLAPWDLNKLGDKSIETLAPSVRSEIDATETFTARAGKFDLSAEIQGSLLGGMFEVSGSAEFLLSSKTSIYMAALNFFYDRRTHMKRLTMDALMDVTYPEVFDMDTGATHVVTGIEYGARAIFKFSRVLNTHMDKVHFQANLKFEMDFKIAKLSGHVNLSADADNIWRINETRCEFFGDVNLERPPVNFADAVEAYKTLPNYVNKSTVVPQIIYLTPISAIVEKEDTYVRSIPLGLLREIVMKMEKYELMEAQMGAVQDCLTHRMMPLFRDHIRSLEKAIKVHKGKFQEKLFELLPKVRGGGATESQLGRAIDDKDEGVNMNALHNAVLSRMRECGRLADYCSRYPEIVMQKFGQFEEIIYNASYRFVITASFYIFPKKDNFSECIRHACSTKHMLNKEHFCGQLNCAQHTIYKSPIDNSDAKLHARLWNLFHKFNSLYLQNRDQSHKRDGEKTKIAIRQLPSDGKLSTSEDQNLDRSKGCALEVYEKFRLVEPNLHLPKIKNLELVDANKKGILVKWTIEIEESTERWLTGEYLIEYAFPGRERDDWKGQIVKLAKGETQYRVPTVCDVKIRVSALCKFGVCYGTWRFFHGYDIGDITCDDERMKAAEERAKKQQRQKEKPKSELYDEQLFRKQRIVIAGGCSASKNYSNEIIIYVPSDGTSSSARVKLLKGRCGHIVETLPSRNMLIAGGLTGENTTTNTVEIVDIDHSTAVIAPHMQQKRAYAASAYWYARVFVCGGIAEPEVYLDTCEMWLYGTWTLVSSMNQKRGAFAMVVLDTFLYVMGGRNNKSHVSLNWVEKYSLQKNQWLPVKSTLVTRRQDHSATVLNGTVYICGGTLVTLRRPTKTCERYNQTSGNWSVIGKMNNDRSAFSLISLADGQIYSMCGFSIVQHSSQDINIVYQQPVDVYNPKLNQWDIEGEVLVENAYSPAVIVNKPPWD